MKNVLIGIAIVIATGILTVIILSETQNQKASTNEILNLDYSGTAICTVETVRSIIDGDTLYPIITRLDYHLPIHQKEINQDMLRQQTLLPACILWEV